MYADAKDQEGQDAVIATLKRTMGKSSSNLTLRDALFNPQYRNATWINFVYIIFHELTGVNVINLYSNQMLKQMQDNGSSSLSPRTGTYIIGVVESVSALFASLVMIKIFGRRTLVLWGHAAMGVTHLMIAIYNNRGNSTGIIVMMNLFMVAYQTTSGPVAWVYAAETNIDAALGFSILTLWGTVLVLSLVVPNIMNDSSLGPTNTFYLFAAFAVLAVIYVYFFFKETKGLMEKEKKLLYTPKRFLERKEQLKIEDDYK